MDIGNLVVNVVPKLDTTAFKNLNRQIKNVAAGAGGLGAASAGAFAGIVAGAGAAAAAVGGIGIAFAAQNEAVKKSFADLGTRIKQELAAAAAPIAPVLQNIAGQLGGLFNDVLPTFQRLFAQFAPVLESFASNAIAAFRPLIPAFERLASAGMPIIKAIGDGLLPLSQALAPVFDQLASAVSGAAGSFVGPLMNGLTSILPILGQLLVHFVEMGAQIMPVVMQVLQSVAGVLQQLVPYFPQLADAAISVVQAFAPLIPILGNLVTALLPPLLSIIQFLAPALPGIAIGVTAIITVVKAWGIAQAILNAVLAANPIMLVVGVLAVLVGALISAWQNSETFRNIVSGVFNAIAVAGQWLWNTILKPVFNAFGVAFNAIGTAVTWVWGTLIKPAWDAIAASAGWLWNTVLKPVFGFISAAWDTLGKGIGFVWNTFIKPIFDGFGRAVDTIKQGFSTAVTWIGQVWDGIKEKLMAPVRWVVDFVWNDGLRKLWNWINNLWNGDDLPRFQLANGGTIPRTGAGTTGGGGTAIRLARGGVMPGYTPGRDVHSFFSPTGGRLDLSGGEAVMRPEWTKALGTGLIDQMNAVARTGGVASVQKMFAGLVAGQAPAQHHKQGGIIDLPGWVDTILNFIPGGGIVEDVINALNGSDTGGGLWGDAIWGTVKKIGSNVWDAIKKLFDTSSGGTGNGTWNANSRHTPNGIGGLGPVAAAARADVMARFGLTNIGGYSYRNIAGTNTLSDHATGHAIDVMIPAYKTPAGIAKGNAVASYFAGGPGAAKYPVKYVIWRDRINSGRGWGPYGHPGGGRSDTLQHRDHVHTSFFDSGGILQNGELGMNTSGKPEAVFSNEQWQVLERFIQAATTTRGNGPFIQSAVIRETVDLNLLMQRFEHATRAGMI